jgi:hypothetical protein
MHSLRSATATQRRPDQPPDHGQGIDDRLSELEIVANATLPRFAPNLIGNSVLTLLERPA